MAEKLGNGGHGPENYDPNTGKYIEDGKPNSSYDNPNEQLDFAATKKQVDFLKNFLQQKNIDVETVRKETKHVPQEFVDKLKRKLNNIFDLSGNNSIHTTIFDGIINDLEDMDENDLKIFMATVDFVSSIQNDDTSAYNPNFYDVFFDFSSIDSTDIDNSYEKNHTFFHEFGHAIDSMIKNKIMTEPGYYMAPYISEFFESEKHSGKTMVDMLIEELGINTLLLNQLKEEEKNYFSDNDFSEIKNINEANQKIKDFQQDYENLTNEINQQISNIIGFDLNIDDYLTLDINGKNIDNVILLSIDSDYDISQSNTIANMVKEIINSKKIKDKIKKLRQIDDNSTKLTESIKKSHIKKCRVWGPISDMYESLTDSRLSCNFGHGRSYFNERSHRRAAELFANLFSARITSQETYGIYKKYCPKTVEIFEDLLVQAGGEL